MSKRARMLVILLIAFLVNACTASTPAPTQLTKLGVTATTVDPTSTSEILTTPTPWPTSIPSSVGPEPEDLPAGYNPLTGQLAADTSLIEIPAMLVSISNFPAMARPQAGLSFAPFVYEFSITEGQTRFLTVFYGEFPEPEIPMTGNCAVRAGVFEQTDLILGNQVWLDANADGIQSAGQRGVGGICVNLYDAAGDQIQKTTTDSNGYYGFNVEPGDYIVEVVKPDWLNFSEPNIGQDNTDSDADPLSGRIEADVLSSLLSLDAGLVPSNQVTATPNPSSVMPKAEVGPIRSGRLLYGHIAKSFTDSCLIYAFASKEVLEQIPKCSFVTHEVQGGGYMLSLQRFRAIAQENARNTSHAFNYSGNLYKVEPPAGGVSASQIDVRFAHLNQSGWRYDPRYQAWLRYVDTSVQSEAGILHAEVDRLTGRQLHFENVIVLLADHEVISPTNLNILVDAGNLRPALLFRDGQMYQIKWSTMAGDYEQKTGFPRPIRFVNPDGTPAALKPGHTWITIVTPFSPIQETSPGIWKITFLSPEGSK